MKEKQAPPTTTVSEPQSAEGAALISLMGNKRIAGTVFYDHQFGMPMLRVEVPATSHSPAFTRYFHTQAVFHVQPCSPRQMQAAAEALKEPMFPAFLSDAGTEK